MARYALLRKRCHLANATGVPFASLMPFEPSRRRRHTQGASVLGVLAKGSVKACSLIPCWTLYPSARLTCSTDLSISTKSLAVPGDNRLWLHNQQSRGPAGPEPRKPYPQNAIGILQASLRFRLNRCQYQELMTLYEDSQPAKPHEIGNSSEQKRAKHYTAAYTPRLHRSNCFNDNEFLVWAEAGGHGFPGRTGMDAQARASRRSGDLGRR